MKKALLISGVVGAMFLAAVAGYGIYWQNKLEPILDSPAARLTPSRFEPVSLTRTKSLNLGYERVSIPESVNGELALYRGTNVITLTDAKGGLPKICFMPPHDNQDRDALALYRTVTRLIGTPINSWYNFQKCLLAQKPISVWQMPALGYRQFRAKLALLALKQLQYSTETSVRIFENERVGVIICNGSSSIFVTLADLKSGLSQEVLIGETVKNVDEVISALASDYELNLPAADDHSIERLINGVGLKAIAESLPSSAAESQRYEDAAKEIQRRRLLREQPDHP